MEQDTSKFLNDEHSKLVQEIVQIISEHSIDFCNKFAVDFDSPTSNIAVVGIDIRWLATLYGIKEMWLNKEIRPTLLQLLAKIVNVPLDDGSETVETFSNLIKDINIIRI